VYIYFQDEEVLVVLVLEEEFWVTHLLVFLVPLLSLLEQFQM
jgi:hypothetical protein